MTLTQSTQTIAASTTAPPMRPVATFTTATTENRVATPMARILMRKIVHPGETRVNG